MKHIDKENMIREVVRTMPGDFIAEEVLREMKRKYPKFTLTKVELSGKLAHLPFVQKIGFTYVAAAIPGTRSKVRTYKYRGD